jgi:hypothetical protein
VSRDRHFFHLIRSFGKLILKIRGNPRPNYL